MDASSPSISNNVENDSPIESVSNSNAEDTNKDSQIPCSSKSSSSNVQKVENSKSPFVQIHPMVILKGEHIMVYAENQQGAEDSSEDEGEQEADNDDNEQPEVQQDVFNLDIPEQESGDENDDQEEQDNEVDDESESEDEVPYFPPRKILVLEHCFVPLDRCDKPKVSSTSK